LIVVGCPLCDNGNGKIIIIKEDQDYGGYIYEEIGQTNSFSSEIHDIGRNIKILKDESVSDLNMNTYYILFNNY